MRVSIIGFLLAAISISSSSFGGDRPKDDLEKLQGVWVIVAGKGSDLDDPESFKGREVRFDGKTFQSYNKSGESEGVYTITLRPDKTPKEIDLAIQKKSGKIVVVGIYAFEKEEVKLCIASGQNVVERPRDFTMAGGLHELRIRVLKKKMK